MVEIKSLYPKSVDPSNKLASIFNIRPGEGQLVGILLLHSFFIGWARIFTRTAAFTLFLVDFEAQTLPYTYIGISIVVTLISLVYLKLGERLSFPKLLMSTLGFLVLSLLAFRLGLELSEALWLVFLLPIWYELLWTLTNLEFWNLTGRLFNVRQGKRLFGLVGAGEQAAIIIGGFLVPLLVAWQGTPNLLLAAAAATAAALGVLIYISRVYNAQLASSLEPSTPAGQKSANRLLNSRYILLTFGLFALAMLGYFFIDNIFFFQAEAQYPDEDQLAGFIGLFFGLVGLLSLLSKTFLFGSILTRLGVRGGLLVTPVILILSGLAVTLTGSVLQALVLFFWLVAMTKLLSLVLIESVDIPAINVLYQPLPATQRVQAQTAVEGIVYPLAIGAAGLILSLLTTVLGFESLQLTYVLLLIVAAWFVLALYLGREYRVALQAALARGDLRDRAPLLADHSSLAVLQEGLDSPQVGVIIYSLDMLAEIAPESLVAFLPELLRHPEAGVRLNVLDRIEQLELTAAVPLIKDRIRYEGSRAVQGASRRVLAALGDAEIFDQVYPYLDDPDPVLRREALVGLLRSGEIEGILAAGEKLIGGVNSADPVEREFAARVLGEGGVSGFYRSILKLLQDDSPRVRRAALLAVGKLKNPKLWPETVSKLAVPNLQAAAVSALAASGEAALPALKAAFAHNEQGRTAWTGLARVCGRIGGPEAAALLYPHLNFPDEPVRSQLLAALSQCKYQARQDEERTYIQQEIKEEMVQVTWTLAAQSRLEQSLPEQSPDAFRLLNSALTNSLARHQVRLFLWLSFIYDPSSMLRARDLLTASASDLVSQDKAYALETIEVMVSPELKAMLLPLWDNLTPAQRLHRLTALFPHPDLNEEQYLQEIITGPGKWFNPWTKVCALNVVDQIAAVALSGAVMAALSDPDPLVRETAVWTMARLDKALYMRDAPDLSQDSSPQVVKAVKTLTTASTGDKVMLTPVEKVIYLKAVDFFAATDEETLAAAAALLEEEMIEAGETILEKGQTGQAMYIIVSGQVHLHDGPRTVAKLGERELFGELSLLNPYPQPVSVTALTETQLLRLDQEPFYELLEEYSSMAHHIIQRLAQRLQRTQASGRPDRARDDLLGGLQERLTQKP